MSETSSPRPATLARPVPTPALVHVALHPAVLWLTVGLIALLPRVLNLGQFVTDDEVNFWTRRSLIFLNALSTGNFGDTAISTHPGVTTMWLGSAGILLRQAVEASGMVANMDYATQMALMRLPLALVHTAAILLGYAMLLRLVEPPIALLGAVFWAADPFVIAYSRLLHVDALLMTGATLSILALACWLDDPRPHIRPYWLVASGVAAAFAVLSKSPGIMLVPFAGVVVLYAGWHARLEPHGWRGWLMPAVRAGVVWGSAYAATVLLLYPALWAAPLQVLELFKTGVTAEGAQPHQVGNYYMGRVNPVPGWDFYLMAILMRTTPHMLLGLLLLPLVWRQPQVQPFQRTLLVLGLFVLLFTLAMSGFPKKFNRYIVPVFPALNILAAAGIVGGVAWLTRTVQPRLHTLVQQATLTTLIALAALNAAFWHPYAIVAFNQLLGGTRAGTWMFSSGWGEGYDQVAAWLNQQEDITGVLTLSIKANVVGPYLKHGAQIITPRGSTIPDQAGYAVVYIYQTQGTVFPPFDQFYPRATPVHTVTLHGVPHARIYQIPPRMQHERADQFGAAPHTVTLRGYSLARPTADQLDVTLQWHSASPPQPEPLLFLHLLDQQGNRLAQADVPPAGPGAPLATWQAARAYTWRHVLPLPPDLADGAYWLALGLYDPATFARLPVAMPPPPDAPDAGGNALLLPITLGPPEPPAPEGIR